MKKFISLIQKNKLITLIILIAVVVRFIGIYPSYPPDHPDEGGYGSSIEMIYNQNFDPMRYDYPSGVALIQLLFFKLFFIPLGWALYFLTHIGDILDGTVRLNIDSLDYILKHDIVGTRQIRVLIWGRLITALFGTLIILLTFLVSRKCYGWWAAIASSFFVAVNFREVLNSHIGLPDIYNAFFLMLAVLFLIHLVDKPLLKNYLLAGLTTAFYICIKFQVFTVIPLILIHIYHSSQQSKNQIRRFVICLFSKKFILAMLLIPLIVVAMNPYHLINFEKFRNIQIEQMEKYRSGTYMLDGYPFAYLYHHALGSITSSLVILGIIISLVKINWKSLILLSVIGQFFYIFTYYSGGGFYTRNFVTIIPLLLVFAGIPFQFLMMWLKEHINRTIGIVVLCIILVIVSWGNIRKSITVVATYSKPWNITIIRTWLEQNIPEDAKVSAHSNVPLSIKDDQRFSYDFHQSFSIDEFIEEGETDYAVTNFAWATGDFYWWMTVPSKDFMAHYWNKPVDIMEYSYPAIAIRELEPYVVFTVFKPWVAPDTDFMVVKVPKFIVGDKKLKEQYLFEKDTNGWEKTGNFWLPADILKWKKGNLVINQAAVPLVSVRWRSPVIEVRDWLGFVVDFKIQDQTTDKLGKGSYIFTSFYRSKEDALQARNRVGVRVSSRTSVPNEWLNKQLIGPIPSEAQFMTINFASYDSTYSVGSISKVNVYEAKVGVDLDGIKTKQFHIDDNNLFPNSHGNL